MTTWKIIKSLNGCPETNSPNEAMIHKGKVLTSNKRKAHAFGSHYASVSRLKFGKEEGKHARSLRRKLKKILNGPSVDGEECGDFTMSELTCALKKMRRKGPDGIPPAFLQELGPKGLQALLDIINQSFREASCPQLWRNAIIVALLKAEKPASELGSYRPVSLTSCVVKVMERMMAERLYHLAESAGMFNHQQAGFRKGRGCDDQIARVIQAIEDGFQHHPLKRSCLVLLDFSKAYDMVWKEKLLMTMIDKGIPLQIIRWLNSFLENRQARVRVNGELGNNFIMRQGLPQGAVLSPILFLFYINTLAERLPEGTINCMFADDVSVLAVENSLEEAQDACQKTVDVVVTWAKEWKLMLNASKSEVSFFTNSTSETPDKWKPTILIDGKVIEYKEIVRLLGILLDRQLSFRPQIQKIEKKTDSKVKMLRALSNTDWGCRKEHLLKVYNGHVKSVVNYAGFAWQPSLRPGNVESLDTIKRRALRVVTGQFARCPNNAPFLEVGAPSTRTEIDREAVKAAEKCLRLPHDHPRRIAFEGSAPKRLMKDNWAILAKRLMNNTTSSKVSRQPLTYFDHPPWSCSIKEITIHSNLEGIKGRNDSKEAKIEAAYKAIRALNPRYTIYTDGSASEGMIDGGSAALLTIGSPDNPIQISSTLKKGAKYTSSYGEEYVAMLAAADIIVEQQLRGPIVIATDSQSLCKAMEQRNKLTSTILKRLSESTEEIIIQWVPGHSDIAGNEMADKAAKEATTIAGDHLPTSFGSVCAAIKQEIPEQNLSGHERTAKVYEHFSKSREKQITSRKDQTTLARIRSGHHKAFKEIHHRLEATVDPTCPKCKKADHTLEHWLLECEATQTAKHEIFTLSGDDQDLGLGLLSKYPKSSLALARRTLLGNSADRPPPQQ